jgi:cytoskeletal protein CcmA (bactofilin family)
MAAGGKVIVNAGALTADATSITTTLAVAGATTLTGALAANGGITVDGSAFAVADTSGNVSTTGTLTVSGLATLNGGITADGGAFAVANTSGNITTTGTLSVTGAVTGAAAILTTGATGGIGYATGAGGAVSQATNRTTGVTINKICGAITTHDASLAAGAEATFTVTNSAVAATDVVVVSLKDKSGTALSIPFVTDVAAGKFDITMTNLDASTADTSASVINFVVIKGVAS